MFLWLACGALTPPNCCTGCRFVKFGGGVSEAQLAWLRQELAAAQAAGERAVVCCHLCFHPATCAPACLLWNYKEVLQVRPLYCTRVTLSAEVFCVYAGGTSAISCCLFCTHCPPQFWAVTLPQAFGLSCCLYSLPSADTA
jgi:hypothetical protein